MTMRVAMRHLGRPRPAVLMATGAVAALLLSIAGSIAAQTRAEDVLVPAVVFASSRDHLGPKSISELFLALEIYVSDLGGNNARRLTNNRANDCYPSLSPDGRRIVFESGRLRSGSDPDNQADLFIMDADGENQRHLVRGSSATWSPDGKYIAYHASASGTGTYNDIFPGAATSDSDIFVLNIDQFLEGKAKPINITANPRTVDEDPDWSPDGKTIVYTAYGIKEDHRAPTGKEVYLISPNGKAAPRKLTSNRYEERAPSWSPDGKRISFVCRNGVKEFQVCVMKADGRGSKSVTTGTGLTHSWEPGGKRIIFHRSLDGDDNEFQLFAISADGGNEIQLTRGPGLNGFPSVGFIRQVLKN